MLVAVRLNPSLHSHYWRRAPGPAAPGATTIDFLSPDRPDPTIENERPSAIAAQRLEAPAARSDSMRERSEPGRAFRLEKPRVLMVAERSFRADTHTLLKAANLSDSCNRRDANPSCC